MDMFPEYDLQVKFLDKGYSPEQVLRMVKATKLTTAGMLIAASGVGMMVAGVAWAAYGGAKEELRH